MTTTCSEFVTNDGVRLVYEVGEGGGASSHVSSPVVLIHGWSGSRLYFDHSFAALVSAPNPPSKVVRYDLRGHGDSDKPAWGYHVARYAADLRDLLGRDLQVARSLDGLRRALFALSRILVSFSLFFPFSRHPPT